MPGAQQVSFKMTTGHSHKERICSHRGLNPQNKKLSNYQETGISEGQ
jgi:hypothetical protein